MLSLLTLLYYWQLTILDLSGTTKAYISGKILGILFKKFLSPRNKSPCVLHKQYCKTISAWEFCCMPVSSALPPSVLLNQKTPQNTTQNRTQMQQNWKVICFYFSVFFYCHWAKPLYLFPIPCLCHFINLTTCFCFLFFLLSWLWSGSPWLQIFYLPYHFQASLSYPWFDLLIQGFLSLHVFCLPLYYTNICVSQNGVLPIHPCLGLFSHMKTCSSVKWKDVFMMKCFTLSCRASLSYFHTHSSAFRCWLQHLKMLKTKSSCGLSLCVSLPYVCICKEDALWQNGTWCQMKCKAGRVSVEGQATALCCDLDGKGCCGLQHQTIPWSGSSERKARRTLPDLWSGCFYQQISKYGIYNT